MSLMLNNVIIAGNITGEIEHKEVGNGSVASFSIALNEKFKKADGSMGDKVHYIEVEAWGKTGEFIKNYFSKGKGICITGSLAQDRWEDSASGQKRSKIKVKAFKADFTGSKGDSDGGQSAPQREAPIQEAAILLGISESTLRRRIRAGQVNARQVETPQGFKWLVEIENIEVDHQVVHHVTEIDAIEELKARVQSLETQLGVKDTQIDQLHHLLAQTSLNAAPARSWWKFW